MYTENDRLRGQYMMDIKHAHEHKEHGPEGCYRSGDVCYPLNKFKTKGWADAIVCLFDALRPLFFFSNQCRSLRRLPWTSRLRAYSSLTTRADQRPSSGVVGLAHTHPRPIDPRPRWQRHPTALPFAFSRTYSHTFSSDPPPLWKCRPLLPRATDAHMDHLHLCTCAQLPRLPLDLAAMIPYRHPLHDYPKRNSRRASMRTVKRRAWMPVL